MVDVRRTVVGTASGVVAVGALGAVLAPLRTHLPNATDGLVLVLPVLGAAFVGGLRAGLSTAVAGFVVFDLVFIPPYGTLTVGIERNWTSLVVYLVVATAVALVVARLADGLAQADEVARSRAESARHLLGLSELLLAEQPDLPGAMVGAVRSAFAIDGVALLQLVDGRLEVVGSAGSPMTAEELARIRSEAHLPVPLSTGASHDVVQTLALASSGRPMGMLVLRGAPDTRAVREALPILANHLAVALERAELHARVHRAELLEEVDRLRQALVGAVSHDLRSPLATIKVASSTLAASSEVLSDREVKELHELIDLQTDRLDRLVTNLLDMTRIQAGALELRRTPTSVTDLVAEAVAGLRAELGDRPVTVVAPDPPPLVDADPLLVGQVLANLLDNAQRHGPPGTAIVVEIAPSPGGRVVVSVSDDGPGVPAAERRAVFETFVRFDTGGRSGLGLAIAKAFLDAHGDRIWVEDAPGGGARFVFTLPRAANPAGVAR